MAEKENRSKRPRTIGKEMVPGANVSRKQTKTTYFFRPENNLTGRKQGNSEDVLKPVDANPERPAIQRIHNETEPESYEQFLLQNQSSDESFEGVKWKISPTHLKTGSPRRRHSHSNNPAINASSSPLKNLVDTGDTLSAIINEQAEQMLLKYGSGFHNISSQTLPGRPGKKAVSDLGQLANNTSRNGSRILGSNPPSLQRAKSLGALSSSDSLSESQANSFNGLSIQNSSRLKSWIHKIDFDEESEENENGSEMIEEKEIKQEDSSFSGWSSVSEDNVDKKRSLGADNVDKKRSQGEANSVDIHSKKSSRSEENFDNSLKLQDLGDSFSDDDILATYVAKTQSIPKQNPNKGNSSSDPIANSSPPRVLISKDSVKDLSEDDFSDFSDDMDLGKVQITAPTVYTERLNELLSIDDGVNLYEPKLACSRSNLKRYKITHIFKTSFKMENKVRQQTILTVKDTLSKESKLVLRGEYTSLNLAIGDIVNVVVTDPLNASVIDDTKNMLIWHPDVLVSSTTVSQQLSCPRKSVLTDKFKFPGYTSLPLIVGIIVHEIFQACFLSENWTLEYMEDLMNTMIDENLVNLYSIGSNEETARSEIGQSLPYLKDWFLKYYKVKGQSKQKIATTARNEVYFAVNKALDIEENIWSPMFGLKGKVDVTLEGLIKSNESLGNLLIPMEIKTGKEYLSHHAQSSLYALLFKDRYDIDVSSFLLVYTKEKLTKLGHIRPSDLKSLINLRNRVVEYLREGIRSLPEVIKRTICDRCEVQRECMTLHYLNEDGDSESSGLKPGRFNEIIAHITNKPLFKDFYNYWDVLITKEETLLKKLKKDLWTMTAKEREQKMGNALANLTITEHSETGKGAFPFSYTFVRSNSSSLNESLQTSHFTKFDRVIVSDEDGHFAIAHAHIVIIRPTMIVVAADRRIINSSVREVHFNELNNQSFEGVLHSPTKSRTQLDKLYRIDKDEMQHNMGLARYNILNLLLADGDLKRTEQIIELKPPRFNSNAPTITNSTFNQDQIKAFNKVLSAEDFCLVLGMPGTGKTTLIAGIISHLVSQGNSVLLASYTHSAVDNILLKVKEHDVGILRIGHPSKVHKDIQQYVPQKVQSFDEFMHIYMDPPVVGTTCLGITDNAFNFRSRFDYCIIDEASQVSLPISLGPLRFCDKYVLVGDHNQLPPLVTHTHPTVKKGLSESLFQYLNTKFPESVVDLTYQYRMSADIMKLSNLLIYNNMLKCGTEEVAKQTLKLPNLNGYKSMVTGERDIWMQWVLNESNNVIFLDHDLVPAAERTVGEKIENPTEALLVWQIIEALTLCGVKQSQIGVMSLYRAQLRLLNKYLLDKNEVEIMTADQFQGRDKECVVISLVRSNNEMKVGDLLQEWRRINVAITRSKSKLIILGSRKTLSMGEGVLKNFLDLVFKEKWMYRLPPKATTHYIQPNLNASQNQTRQHTSPTRHRIAVHSKVVRNHPIIKDCINEHNGSL